MFTHSGYHHVHDRDICHAFFWYITLAPPANIQYINIIKTLLYTVRWLHLRWLIKLKKGVIIFSKTMIYVSVKFNQGINAEFSQHRVGSNCIQANKILLCIVFDKHKQTAVLNPVKLKLGHRIKKVSKSL